jgi:hypothetical protein
MIRTIQISIFFSRIVLIHAEFGYRANGEFQFGIKFGRIAVYTYILFYVRLIYLGVSNIVNKYCSGKQSFF